MGISKVLIFVAVFLLCMGNISALQLKVIVTGDMHGWMEPRTMDGNVIGGAAEMLACWRSAEGYAPEKFLLISCGDIATGPAISTAYKGESTVKAMNMMGYDVSVLGNHEFDFGRGDGVKILQKWAKFPVIAGNIAYEDGRPVEFIPQTMMYEEQGVKVGIVGLTLQNLSNVTQPIGMVGLPYAETVRKKTAELRAAGAKVIIVASHAPQADVCALAKEVADLGIPLMLGGHSHEVSQQKIGNTWVVSCGRWWECYGRIDLDVDIGNGSAAVISAKQIWLMQKPESVQCDSELKAEIARWHDKVNSEYGEVLGYTAAGLKRQWSICNLVTGSWLASFPADLAICNLGGFRQDIGPGDVRSMDIMGIMPFEDSVFMVKLTGAQLEAYVSGVKKEVLVFGGAVRNGEKIFLASSGKEIDASASYKVLINNFLYGLSSELKAADPNPQKTAADWRNPVMDWLKKNPTSRDRPLETLLELPRKSD